MKMVIIYTKSFHVKHCYLTSQLGLTPQVTIIIFHHMNNLLHTYCYSEEKRVLAEGLIYRRFLESN